MKNKKFNHMKIYVVVLLTLLAGCGNRDKYQDVFVAENYIDPSLMTETVTVCNDVVLRNYNGFCFDGRYIIKNNTLDINLKQKKHERKAKLIYKLYKKNNVIALVIDNNNIYYCDKHNKLVCIDKNTYKKQWSLDILKTKEDCAVWLSSDFSRNTIIAVSDKGHIVNIDTQNKKVKWTKEIDVPLHGSAAIVDNKVIVYRGDNAISAYFINCGKHAWSFDKLSSDMIFSNSGNFDYSEKKLLCTYSTGECSLVNTDQGEEYWSNTVISRKAESAIDLYGVMTAKPIIHNNRAIVSNARGNTTAFDLETGLPIWTNNVGAQRNMCMCNKWVFAIDNENNLVCMSATTGKIKYKTNVHQELLKNTQLMQRNQKYYVQNSSQSDIKLSNPLIVNGKIMVADGIGSLLFFNTNNGKLENVVTYTSLTDFVPVNVFIEDKTVYILSNDARLYVVK